MSQFNSFIALKEAFPVESFMIEQDTQWERLQQEKKMIKKRLDKLFDRVKSKADYYGISYKIVYSNRSNSRYLISGDKQIRISDHAVAPGNIKSELEFLVNDLIKTTTKKLLSIQLHKNI